MSAGHIAVYFTRGVSLQNWEQSGVFDREVALYCRLVDQGYQVTFVTYGDGSDCEYSSRLPGIRICPNRWNLKKNLYGTLSPWLHYRALRDVDIFKSNQFDGAVYALRAARLHRKPFVARGGYSWSGFVREKWGKNSERYLKIKKEEVLVLQGADCVLVTSRRMKEDLEGENREKRLPVEVIPNYVDTDVFCPEPAGKCYDFIYIGRLSPQKNLHRLLNALKGTGYRLAIAGDGELRNELKSEFGDLGSQVEWLGARPFAQLPSLIRQSRVFVLASDYEGHPKVMVEAMSCGACVLGTRVPGILDMVDHGENGWLCEASIHGIRQGMKTLMNDDALRRKLGQAARERAVTQYSLSRIVEQESRLYESLMKS